MMTSRTTQPDSSEGWDATAHEEPASPARNLNTQRGHVEKRPGGGPTFLPLASST